MPKIRFASLPLLLLAAVIGCGGSAGTDASDAPDAGVDAAPNGEPPTAPGPNDPKPTPDEDTTCTITTSSRSGEWDPAFARGIRKLPLKLETRHIVFEDDGGVLLAGDETNQLGTGFTDDVAFVALDAAGNPRESFGAGGVARAPANAFQGKPAALWGSRAKGYTFAITEVFSTSIARLGASGTLDASFGTNGKTVLPGICVVRGTASDGALLYCMNNGVNQTIVLSPTGGTTAFPAPERGLPDAAVRDADGAWVALAPQGIAVVVERWSDVSGALTIGGAAKSVTIPGMTGSPNVFLFRGADKRVHVLGSNGEGGQGTRPFAEVAITPAGTFETVARFSVPIGKEPLVQRLCDGRIVVADNVYPASPGAPHTLRVAHLDAQGRPIAARGRNGVTETLVTPEDGYGLMARIDARTGAVMWHRPVQGSLWMGRMLP